MYPKFQLSTITTTIVIPLLRVANPVPECNKIWSFGVNNCQLVFNNKYPRYGLFFELFEGKQ